MAKNGAKGGGRRGAIRNRMQFRLPNGHYAKVNRTTGAILSIKADRHPYKGVVIQRNPSPTMVAQALATPARATRPALRVMPWQLPLPAPGVTPAPCPAVTEGQRLAA